MTGPEKPPEGVQADEQRSRERDARLSVEGESPLVKFSRVWNWGEDA